MTRKEVAKRLGLSVPQVRRAEQSGLRKLREALEARGITSDVIRTAFGDRPPVALPEIVERIWSEDEEEEVEEG